MMCCLCNVTTIDAKALGRVVALDAGNPIEMGFQIDRSSDSRFDTLVYASLLVAWGVSDLMLADCADSISHAPFYTTEAAES